MPENEPNATPAASADPAGQQPTNGNASSQQQSADPNATQTPAAQGANEPTQQQQDPTVQNPEAKRYADEAAKWRKQAREQEKRLAELEAAEKQRQEASLTAQERAEKRAAEAEKKLSDRELAYQERLIRAEVRAHAADVGIKPQLAARLIDYAEIEFDDEGEPTNIGKLLGKLVKDYPELKAAAGSANGSSQQNGQSSQGVPNPGATNPERQGGPITVTATQYSDAQFIQEFRTKYGMDLTTAVLRGKATII